MFWANIESYSQIKDLFLYLTFLGSCYNKFVYNNKVWNCDRLEKKLK